MSIKESQEFKERKELIKLQKEADLERHELKMKEILANRENDRLHHEREMERQRIKSAEIMKTQLRRTKFGGY